MQNSLLQALFHNDFFRYMILSWRYEPDLHGSKEKCIPLQLQILFARMLFSLHSIETTKALTDSFAWDDDEIFLQHDAQEMLKILFDALSLVGARNLDFSDNNSAHSFDFSIFIKYLFTGKLRDTLKCLSCNSVKSRDEEFLDVLLNAEGHIAYEVTSEESLSELPNVNGALTSKYTSLHRAIRSMTAREILSAGNSVRCGKCAKMGDKGSVVDNTGSEITECSEKQLGIAMLPMTICFHVNRLYFDRTAKQMRKNNEPFDFPFFFQSSPFVLEAATDSRPNTWGSPINQDARKGIVRGNTVRAISLLRSKHLSDASPHPESDAGGDAASLTLSQQRIVNANTLPSTSCITEDHKLAGFLMHSGDAVSGHYFLFIRTRRFPQQSDQCGAVDPSDQNAQQSQMKKIELLGKTYEIDFSYNNVYKWLLINDNLVEEVTPAQVALAIGLVTEDVATPMHRIYGQSSVPSIPSGSSDTQGSFEAPMVPAPLEGVPKPWPVGGSVYMVMYSKENICICRKCASNRASIIGEEFAGTLDAFFTRLLENLPPLPSRYSSVLDLHCSAVDTHSPCLVNQGEVEALVRTKYELAERLGGGLLPEDIIDMVHQSNLEYLEMYKAVKAREKLVEATVYVPFYFFHLTRLPKTAPEETAGAIPNLLDYKVLLDLEKLGHYSLHSRPFRVFLPSTVSISAATETIYMRILYEYFQDTYDDFFIPFSEFVSLQRDNSWSSKVGDGTVSPFFKLQHVRLRSFDPIQKQASQVFASASDNAIPLSELGFGSSCNLYLDCNIVGAFQYHSGDLVTMKTDAYPWVSNWSNNMSASNIFNELSHDSLRAWSKYDAFLSFRSDDVQLLSSLLVIASSIQSGNAPNSQELWDRDQLSNRVEALSSHPLQKHYPFDSPCLRHPFSVLGLLGPESYYGKDLCQALLLNQSLISGSSFAQVPLSIRLDESNSFHKRLIACHSNFQSRTECSPTASLLVSAHMVLLPGLLPHSSDIKIGTSAARKLARGYEVIRSDNWREFLPSSIQDAVDSSTAKASHDAFLNEVKTTRHTFMGFPLLSFLILLTANLEGGTFEYTAELLPVHSGTWSHIPADHPLRKHYHHFASSYHCSVMRNDKSLQNDENKSISMHRKDNMHTTPPSGGEGDGSSSPQHDTIKLYSGDEILTFLDAMQLPKSDIDRLKKFAELTKNEEDALGTFPASTEILPLIKEETKLMASASGDFSRFGVFASLEPYIAPLTALYTHSVIRISVNYLPKLPVEYAELSSTDLLILEPQLKYNFNDAFQVEISRDATLADFKSVVCKKLNSKAESEGKKHGNNSSPDTIDPAKVHFRLAPRSRCLEEHETLRNLNIGDDSTLCVMYGASVDQDSVILRPLLSKSGSQWISCLLDNDSEEDLPEELKEDRSVVPVLPFLIQNSVPVKDLKQVLFALLFDESPYSSSPIVSRLLMEGKLVPLSEQGAQLFRSRSGAGSFPDTDTLAALLGEDYSQLSPVCLRLRLTKRATFPVMASHVEKFALGYLLRDDVPLGQALRSTPPTGTSARDMLVRELVIEPLDEAEFVNKSDLELKLFQLVREGDGSYLGLFEKPSQAPNNAKSWLSTSSFRIFPSTWTVVALFTHLAEGILHRIGQIPPEEFPPEFVHFTDVSSVLSVLRVAKTSTLGPTVTSWECENRIAWLGPLRPEQREIAISEAPLSFRSGDILIFRLDKDEAKALGADVLPESKGSSKSVDDGKVRKALPDKPWLKRRAKQTILEDSPFPDVDIVVVAKPPK